MSLLIKWGFVLVFSVFSCVEVGATNVEKNLVSSSPRRIELKPNATEGYAQTMREPPVVEANTHTTIIILPPFETFREMDIFLDPLSIFFFNDRVDTVFFDRR
ncbi:hypothetical protein A5482_005580 [Cyanobacterium sp. IPPAS B-1200]|uniref:hypothetical protein n=1 Tax=Cyanobacterium sp. IPPAS B-1200 TaxID=1562720 RepID=UPI0008525615|nr:hypothetical protein [Cyanobacterium sp. IPPAS B-1200]OEJ78762.1 hypothetical protein A5482_02515 [Cyanobacterium sp. IPPAS B-1200]